MAVTLISDRDDRLVVGAELLTDDGVLRVDAARPHQKGWLVCFEGVTDRTAAEALAGTILRAETDTDTDTAPEGLWVHEVIGLEVVETTGERHGRVVAVQQNPAHDLLVLDDDVLVPSVFISSIGDRIVVDAPEGLFE